MNLQPAKRISEVSEYYFSRKLKEIDKMRREGAKIINLGIGSPDLAPSEATIQKLIETCQLPQNHGYQSYIGIPALRAGIADWYKKYYRVYLNPDNEILPLMGSKEGIMHISMAFINAGDEVLLPNPGYPTYQSVSRIVEAGIRFYDLKEENDWYPDFAALDKQDLSNVKLMWVNYPHMPTGKNSSVYLLNRLVEFGYKHNILICNDNPYSFILNDEPLSILSVNGAKEVALEMNSLSKSHNMAGWRIGMVAGKAEYLSHILRVKSNMDSGMFLPLQLAAVEALKNPQDWYTRLNKIYLERRKVVYEILDIIGCTYDKTQSGLFVWAKFSEKFESAEKLSDYILYNALVFLTPGFIFGSNGNQYIRIALCSPVEVLTEARDRIQKLFK